jgi:hypothetical protein
MLEHRSRSLAVAIVLCLTTAALQAQGEDEAKAAAVDVCAAEAGGVEAEAAEDEACMPQFSFSLSLIYTTGYWGRGVFIENEDAILQPTLATEMKIYEDETCFVHSFSFTFESFNSLDWGPSGESGDHSSPDLWNESDANLGIAVGFAESFAFAAYYSWIISPNNSYDTIEELDFVISYDDAALWESIGVEDFGGVQPYVAFAVEMKNQTDGGFHKGVYLELGVAPSFTLIECDDFYLSMTVPLTLGTSVTDYYEDSTGADDFFGYFDFGIDFALPLTFIPSCLGTWECVFGVHGLLLGDTAAELNEGGDHFEVIGSFGVAVSF